MQPFILPIVQRNGATVQQPVIYQYTGENRFLSNFAPASVVLRDEDGLPDVRFNNIETAYVAWKTLDYSLREHISKMKPAQAKQFSHAPEFPLRPDFTDDNRIAIMHRLLRQKFSRRNFDLMQQLMETKDALLIEGNTWGDAFFGFDLLKGFGQNHLGRGQMDVRTRRLLNP